MAACVNDTLRDRGRRTRRIGPSPSRAESALHDTSQPVASPRCHWAWGQPVRRVNQRSGPPFLDGLANGFHHRYARKHRAYTPVGQGLFSGSVARARHGMVPKVSRPAAGPRCP